MSQPKNSFEITDEMYQAVFEQSAHGILVLEGGALVYANNAAMQILQIPQEQRQAWTLADLLKSVHPSDTVYVVQNPLESQAAKMVLKQNGFFRLLEGGNDEFIEMSCTPLALEGCKAQVLTLTHRNESGNLEAHVEQHNKLLENILDTISDPYYVVDAKTRQILFANEAARDIADNPKGFLCRTINPENPDICQGQKFCPFDISIKTGLPSTAEHILTGSDGHKQYFEVHTHPLFDRNGEIVQVIEHFVDTTANRHVELSLLESEKRYSSLFENNHTVMLLIEPNTGEIIDANGTASDYYGFDRKKIRTMNILHIAVNPPGDTLLRAGHMALRLVTQHRLAGNEVRDVEIFCGPISIGGKKLIYMIVHDITERTRIERTLRERYDYETLAATLATRFIGFTSEELDSGIDLALKEIGRFTGVDRSTLYYSGDTNDLVDTIFEWHATRVKPISELIRQEQTGRFSWLIDRMKNFEAFRLSSLNDLPPQADEMKLLYRRWGIGSLLLVPFITAGNINGLIGLSLVEEGRIWSDNDVMLLRIVGEMIIRSLERKRFEQEVTQSRDRLKDLSAHIQERVESERANIAREVHDELGQLLTALKFDISLLKNKVPENNNDVILKTESMSQLIDQAISSVQRISSELRPVLLDDLGLSAAIEWLVRSFGERTGIACEISIDDVQIKGPVATALFRICQEALTNVGRHSYATEVYILLERVDNGLHLQIHDNGVGLMEEKIHDSKSYGLIGLQERALFHEGSVSIIGSKGEGTKIDVHIPYACGRRSEE